MGQPAEAWRPQAGGRALPGTSRRISGRGGPDAAPPPQENDQLQHVIAVHEQLTHVVAPGAGPAAVAEALGGSWAAPGRSRTTGTSVPGPCGDIAPLADLARAGPTCVGSWPAFSGTADPGRCRPRFHGRAGEGSPGARDCRPVFLGEELLGFLST